MKERIFLSAVTGQFKVCRDTLRSDLAAVGADVVVQEDFQQHGGTLLEKLEEYIDSCDRVIALVGSAYGWEPEATAIPASTPRRSYTQWEYHFAMGDRLGGARAEAKPVYVYFATPAYLENYPAEQSQAEASRQQQFIDEICASGKDHNQFDSTQQLARLVLRDGFKLPNASEPLLHNLPYDSLGPLFKGRKDFVAEIQANLSTGSGEATAIVAKQAIHGLGGVGKTRLAVEYAWHCLQDYSACLFVNADSPKNLERNLAELCGMRVFDLAEQEAQEQEQQVAAALGWFNKHSGWLLILDNVDTLEAARAVTRLLPSFQRGHVLITSRRTDWSDSIRSVALDTLSEDDAADFLLDKTRNRRMTSDADVDAAHTLARTMDGLALALEQAAAFINKKRISLEVYQQRWTEQEEKLRHWHDDRAMDYPRSLAVAWETSFRQLSGGAQMLLNALSWFAPEPIPRETFEVAFDALTVVSKLDSTAALQLLDPEDLLEELESLSLLKWQTNNRHFCIHRLVQEITQSRLGDCDYGDSLCIAGELIHRALPLEPPANDVRSWPVWQSLRPHIEQFIHAADVAGVPDVTTRLMTGLGQYLVVKNLFHEAEPLIRRALLINEASLGDKHPTVAANLSNLAGLLRDTGRLTEAEPLIRRALSINEASLGGEHPTNANDLNDLATLLSETDRQVEAEPLMRRALLISEANLGSEHPTIATHLVNLAGLLQDTNRRAEAEPLMRRALLIFETSFGNNHPSVARALNNLASLLGDTGRLAEAESLMRRALKVDEANLGSEHPAVAIDLHNLASLLIESGRLDEAEPLSRKAGETLLLFTRRSERAHPQLFRVISTYSMILGAMGYGNEGLDIRIQALIKSVDEVLARER